VEVKCVDQLDVFARVDAILQRQNRIWTILKEGRM